MPSLSQYGDAESYKIGSPEATAEWYDDQTTDQMQFFFFFFVLRSRFTFTFLLPSVRFGRVRLTHRYV